MNVKSAPAGAEAIRGRRWGLFAVGLALAASEALSSVPHHFVLCILANPTDAQASDARHEVPYPRGVVGVAEAVRAKQVGLLDESHLDLERDDKRREPREGRGVRHEQREPKEGRIIAEKIGLRTTAKGPPVTSSVLSFSSTPMRHEAPNANSVPARPAKERTNPSACPTDPSRAATGPNASARPSRRAARQRRKAATNSTPPVHSAERGRPLIPLRPVEPVERSCKSVRPPKASAR
jgi:hypothetical protein